MAFLRPAAANAASTAVSAAAVNAAPAAVPVWHRGTLVAPLASHAVPLLARHAPPLLVISAHGFG
jgi:hypothetical protein